MKYFLSALILMFLATLSSAQYNLQDDIYKDYCNHMKSAQDPYKHYSFPIPSHPLLDQYDVHFYFLDLIAENDTVYIEGAVTIEATVTAALMDTFAFELIQDLTIDAVNINGVQHTFLHQGDYGFVPLQVSLEQGQNIAASIRYHGTPPSGGFFRGISTDYNEDWDKHVTWTLSEPYAAKEWFPVKQDLEDKADSVWVFITTSAENMAGSVGLLTNVTIMINNKLRYEWKSHYPTAYYLISLAVADYQDYSFYAHPPTMQDSILVQNFIYDHPDYLPTWKDAIDQTAEFLELFSDIFGPYPFAEEKYGHCVSEIGGGMEHQTMTTLTVFNYGLVAHELGHMWYGDNVTCAYWNDIWINEGFATYSDYLAHHFLTTPYYDSVWLKIRHNHVKTQPDGSVYVPNSSLDDIYRIFSGRLSYSKGALLLHMIRFELQDDELFFDILRGFTEQYGDSVATGMDFKALVEEMSGQDFDDFFNQWYFGEGYPIYDIVWNQTSDTLNIYSTQTTSAPVTPLFKMLVPYHVIFEDQSDTTLLLYQEQSQQAFAIPLDKPIAALELDPDQWILHELNSLTIGIEDPGNPVYFSIGPNPARDQVRIFTSHDGCENCELILTDLTGRILIREEMTAGTRTLNLAGYSQGIYMITLTNGVNTLTRKIYKTGK